jgi:signal transduction histidine kinase
MPTVLVVDDTPDNVALLSSLLKGDYRIKVATSGEKALRIALEGEPPDLILLDIIMPGMDGFEVCRRLKQSEHTRSVPVIFLSALNETMDKVTAFRVGGVDYVTKPFQAEEVKSRVEMHLRLHELQVALQRQNRDLQESYSKLREIESLKDSLVHMIIHDMRTPLTSIYGYLKSMEMYESATLSDEGKEFLSIVSDSTQKLIDMVNSLLDVSKMESGEMKLNIEEVDLTAVARDVITALDSLKGDRVLTVDGPDNPATIGADARLIHRVIQNLVGNALKFTPEDGEIRITIDVDGEQARVSVTDNGSGIPVQFQSRIFEKFGQVEAAANRNVHSTGLGLTFCKLAVEAHGGIIGVDSEEGKGSTFWFTLPAAEVATGVSQ